MKRTSLAIGMVASVIGCGSGADSREDDTSWHEQPGNKKVSSTLPAAAAECDQMTFQPQKRTWTIDLEGAFRTFNVIVPSSYSPHVPTPLVLHFHAFTLSPDGQEWMTGMAKSAEKNGFILVYPAGTGIPSSFNGGACCGGAQSSNVDDVGFASKILDSVEASICVDKHRVFATGLSNGGFMSHRLGCELSSRIAAIAPVSGVIGVTACNPSRAMPVIEFHGINDPIVPYNGQSLFGWPSVQDTVDGWSRRNHCTGLPIQTMRTRSVECVTKGDCEGGAEVTLCSITGGGHAWPGGLSSEVNASEFSANDQMWSFFKRHPMP